MNNKNNYCVIMAGGIGSRFWPLSTTETPKQFLDIMDVGRSLIQLTFDRFKDTFPIENFLVVTGKAYKELVKKHLPELDDSQILCEPIRRNTAPCIAYAIYKIMAKCENANIVVAPSDHLILNKEKLLNEINKGLDFISTNNVLLTIGIKPGRPETGYGYIQTAKKENYKDFANLFQVKTFTEKPDLKMAKVFIETKEFLWNSGIFMWSASAIREAFNKYLPDISSLFEDGIKLLNSNNESNFIKKAYSECPNISIDYGIMEKADNVFVLCSDFEWSDLGTWSSLHENHNLDENGNAIWGDKIFTYNTSNSILSLPKEKTAVIQGLDNFIIVESKNVLLICRREDEQQIKQFVTDINLANNNQNKDS